MTKSSYYDRMTIAEVAQGGFRRLLDGARDGGTDRETPAGSEAFLALQFTLSGGGPGSDVVLLFDEDPSDGGEVREGFYSYYESGGTEVIAFGRQDGQAIYDALQREPRYGLPLDAQCSTCAYSPVSETLDEANDEHLHHDGAHLPRWVSA